MASAKLKEAQTLAALTKAGDINGQVAVQVQHPQMMGGGVVTLETPPPPAPPALPGKGGKPGQPGQQQRPQEKQEVGASEDRDSVSLVPR